MRKLLFASLLLTVACATNPVTHKREFNIVSEGQEIQIGQQSHEQVIRQFGVYDEKPELNRLVDTVGHRLAAASDRPNLPWHFTVIDTPMVNAMALPGGYVYITRGMLERINSEDELAGVLGHEITHVTARHAAQQISRVQLAQFGMVLGAVIAGPEATQQYGQLAELGLGLLFQRYSRSQESQADLVGTEYVARAGWNPIGSERMLVTLQRLDKHPVAGIERYFQSHPDPARRVRDVEGKLKEIAATNPAALANEPQRAPYVRLTDGIMTANSTERVTIRAGTVYDREHGLIVQAPAGWSPTVAEGMLFAMTPKGRAQNSAFMVQEVEARELQGSNAQDAIRAKFQQMGLQFAGSRETTIGSGQRFVIDVWSGQTDSGPVGVETTQFLHGDHVAVMMFLSPSLSRDRSPLGDILQRAVIDLGRARGAQPARIRVETARSGDSWSVLARRATGNAADAEEIANMNGFDVKEAPRAGVLVKLPSEVVGDEK
ncbi:MAG TPA: M48 family metalloprotease [Thermoanaerobaculia bacterium]|nr:M48 family metalloprotease [Thermoanaerobaculia bacterium]